MAAFITGLTMLICVGHLKDAAIDQIMAGKPFDPRGLLKSVRSIDVLFCTASVVTLAWLIYEEIKSRLFSRLIASATPGQWCVCGVLFTAWCGHAYFYPGVLLGGDTGTHISRFNEVARGLAAGALPWWTNYQYTGAPLLWFTGPLSYVVGGAVAALVGNALLATKILLFLCHILAFITFWQLLRRFAVGPVAAMAGAVGFACSFARLQLFLYRGVLPQGFTTLFLVLLFFGADLLLRPPEKRAVGAAIFAAATAGLIINHQPHALFAAFYLAVFGACAILTGLWSIARLPTLVVAGILGGVTGSVAVIPTILEAQDVMLQPEGAAFMFNIPPIPKILELVTWANTRTNFGGDYWAWLGIGLIGGIAACVVLLCSGRLRLHARFALPALICLVCCLFVHNPVVRDIQFILFFGALAMAAALDNLISAGWRGRGLGLILALAFCDLAITSVQPVARTDKQFLITAGRWLEQNDPDQRVMQISLNAHGTTAPDLGPDGGPLSYDALVQRVAGNHNMAATRIHNALLVALSDAAADLDRTHALSAASMQLLALLNVGHVICETPRRMGCPSFWPDAGIVPALGLNIGVPSASPALFSTRLVDLSLAPGLEKPMLWPRSFHQPADRPRIDGLRQAWRDFLKTEQPDFARSTATAIAVTNGAPSPITPEAAPDFGIGQYRVALEKVSISVHSNVAGFVQLSHPWLPSMRATVNGRPSSLIRGTMDMVVVPIQAGTSQIDLADGWTFVRRISAILSASGVIGIALFSALLAAREASRRKRDREAAALALDR